MKHLLFTFLLLAQTAWAEGTIYQKSVETWSPGAIAAAATATFSYDSAGLADVFGVSWLCGATPTISLTFQYANGPDDPHVNGVSQSGITYVNNINVTTQDGLSDLKVPPCTSIDITATNNGGATITPTFRIFHQ